MTEQKTGLELLREPFPDHLISKLPKGTKSQNQCKPEDKINCNVCGGWHHPKIIHLDYVGHAALTDRLLDADPRWYWEPVAFNDLGLPAFDQSGGLWIRLYIRDGDEVVNRLGYGHATESNFKEIGSREKEVIGDALRNAAMRFGAALDLWHKGDLHPDKDNDDSKKEKQPFKPKNGEYHELAITVMPDRIESPEWLKNFIVDEVALAKNDPDRNALDVYKASAYAAPEGCECIAAPVLLKQLSPEVYAQMRTEVGKLFPSKEQ